MTNQTKPSNDEEQEALKNADLSLQLQEIDVHAGPASVKIKPSQTISLNTKQLSWYVLFIVIAVILGIVIKALYGGPYMTKMAEISATATKEAFLKRDTEITKVADTKIIQSEIAYPYTYIEESAMTVFEFQKNAGAYFFLSTYKLDDGYTNRYLLKYTIDPDSPGWAGISFEFFGPIDFSQYNSLVFTIQFTENPAPLWLDVYSLKPGTKDNQRTRLKIGDGQYGSLVGFEQSIRIPFHVLIETDVSQITNIIVTSDETLVNNPEEHEFSVSEIKFEKGPEK